MAKSQLITSATVPVNTAMLLLANVACGLSQWSIYVMTAKLGSPEMVGLLAVALAITAPIFMLTSTQLRTVASTDLTDAYNLGEYVGLQALLVFAAIIILICLSFYLGHTAEQWWIVFLVACMKAVDVFASLLHGFQQRANSLFGAALSLMVNATLSLFFAYVALATTRSLYYAVLGLAIASLMAFLLIDIPQTRKVLLRAKTANAARPKHMRPVAKAGWVSIRPASMIALCKHSAPLGGVVALNSFTGNVPRYFLEVCSGPRELGIFAALAGFTRLNTQFEGAVAQAILPRLTRLIAASRSADLLTLSWHTLAGIFLANCFVLGLVVACGPQIMSVVYTPVYQPYHICLVLLIAASALGSCAGVLKTSLDAAGRFSSQIPLFCIAALMAIGLSYLLVPTLSVMGAAVSVLLTKLFLCLGYGTLLITVYGMPRPALTSRARDYLLRLRRAES